MGWGLQTLPGLRERWRRESRESGVCGGGQTTLGAGTGMAMDGALVWANEALGLTA